MIKKNYSHAVGGLILGLTLGLSGCSPSGERSGTQAETPAPEEMSAEMSAGASTGESRADAPESHVPGTDTEVETSTMRRYLPGELMPQKVRQYAEDQPVLVHPWKTVPRAAGFDRQHAYILATYSSLAKLPAKEREAAIRGVITHLPPILERSADGRVNPVMADFERTYPAHLNLDRMNDASELADLYFHAQSPFADASAEVRDALRGRMIKLMMMNIHPDALTPGHSAGEYEVSKVLRPYLLLEIFEPEALSMEQRRTLNRLMCHPFYGFNGQMLLARYAQEVVTGILNKQVFVYNHLLTLATLMELQMVRYPDSDQLWTGFSKELPVHFRNLLAEIALNYGNTLMGDGATRYVPNYTHAYFYEGPQMPQMFMSYLNTYDEDDPVLMKANRALEDRILAMGNYYEQTTFRVVEKDEDSSHTFNRVQTSEAKSFGNELVNRESDPPIHWGLANLTGNRWLRHAGPAVKAQRALDDPGRALRLSGFYLASLWNPEVEIEPDTQADRGFRRDYILWDRNNLGATGKFGNWGFHLVGRGLMGRRSHPGEEVPALFQKNGFAGFTARSAGSPPTEDGLRTDHRMAQIPTMGIFPEKQRFWGAVRRQHPAHTRSPGYPPHWEAAHWSSTVTDGFAVQTSSARADSTDAVCRELWLATPNGAVGLLSGDVSEDPENGNGYARLSFLLHGVFGTRIRDYNKQQGFHADPVPSPSTFPTLTKDKNGFDFLNLRVRVLEQNFTPGPVFAHLEKEEDFYPVDKESQEMRGLEPLRAADSGSHGAVTREVQTRGRFVDGRKPLAVVAVHTGDQDKPITGRRLPPLPGVLGEHLAMQVVDGDLTYVVVYNPSEETLDLSDWTLNSDAVVRTYRSGARYRPDFLGNIETNPEVDQEDEVTYGSVIQTPVPQPLREAIREQIPPHAHLVLVTGSDTFRTGGPGFDLRPPMAQWRFRPENRDGTSTRELTGQGPALSGGEQTEIDALRVEEAGALTGDALEMPAAGTVRFWVRPEALPKVGTSLLFASGGRKSVELWWSEDSLALRWTEDGQVATRHFDGGLASGVWQQVVLLYASADPESWTLRVNGAPRKARAGQADLPTASPGLVLGRGFAGGFKDLAVHPAVPTPGELNHLQDREQPRNFNRIVVEGTPARIWVNGNHLNFGAPGEVDTDKITRHLRPGKNVIGFEFTAGQLKSDPSVGIWIRGRKLTAEDTPFNRGWQTVGTNSGEVGSWLIAAYDAQVNRQLEHLRSQGKTARDYHRSEWRPGAYDRPWLSGTDELEWQAVSWAGSSDTGMSHPHVSAASGAPGLRLLRFSFDLDDQGVPQPPVQ